MYCALATPLINDFVYIKVCMLLYYTAVSVDESPLNNLVDFVAREVAVVVFIIAMFVVLSSAKKIIR